MVFACYSLLICSVLVLAIKPRNLSVKKKSTFVALKPLAIDGLYKSAAGVEREAVYLSREKLEIITQDDDDFDEGRKGKSVILSDVLPLIMERHQTSMSLLVNRDGGIYDNLPFSWSKSGLRYQEQKKCLYDRCSLLRNQFNPVLALLQAAEGEMGARLDGLVIEAVDDFGKGGIVLGGAALFSRWDTDNTDTGGDIDTSKEGSDHLIPIVVLNRHTRLQDLQHVLSSSPSNKAEVGESHIKQCLVSCHLDELVSLSRAANLRLWAPRSLYEQISLDAELTQTPMLIVGGEINGWEGRYGREDSTGAGDVSVLPKAWEIFDPSQFIKMSQIDKRAILRASKPGEALPRPREGRRALDAALLDLMDSAVRGEVIRRQEVIGIGLGTDIDTADPDTTPTTSESSDSDKPDINMIGGISGTRAQLLKMMGEALEAGDVRGAEDLRGQFAKKTYVRADPTQDEGAYDRYLDQDDWYAEARRRAMAPKKPKEVK